MTKSFGRILVFGVVALSLAACQSFDTARLKKIKETENTHLNAMIFCSGTERCEFERADAIQIMNESNKRIDKSAMNQGIVRLNGQSLKEANPLYLSVPAKQHEVVIRFYPVSINRAEKLHVIHHFKPMQTYTFNMYRSRSGIAGSLLEVSAPEPLCVDLIEGKKTIRRFCKPYNALTGLGEFVEQKI
jgi:hypothetical protein